MKFEDALGYILKPESNDWDKYLEAGMILANNRGKLAHRIFVSAWRARVIDDPRWEVIKQSSSDEKCSCCDCRAIWPRRIPDFRIMEEKILNPNDKIFIVPAGGHYCHAEMMLGIEPVDGGWGIRLVKDPYTNCIESVCGLAKLYQMIRNNSRPVSVMAPIPRDARTNAIEQTLLSINQATKETLTIAIGPGYFFSKDPFKEIGVGHSWITSAIQ